MPRADFACLSRKCKTEAGEASVYELPVGATRCPVCGSKRIARLFNAVNISSGLAKRTDALVEPAYEHARAKIDQDSVARAEKLSRGVGGIRMVPLAGVGDAVAKITGGQMAYRLPGTMGSSDYKRGEVMGRPPSAETSVIHQVAPRPTILAVDREFKMVRKGDTIEAARA